MKETTLELLRKYILAEIVACNWHGDGKESLGNVADEVWERLLEANRKGE